MGRQNVALFLYPVLAVVGLPIPIRDQLAIPSSHTHKRRHCPLPSPQVFLAMRNAPFDSLALYCNGYRHHPIPQIEIAVVVENGSLALDPTILPSSFSCPINERRNSEFANFYLKRRTFMYQRIVRKFNSCPCWCIFVSGTVGRGKKQKLSKTSTNPKKASTSQDQQLFLKNVARLILGSQKAPPPSFPLPLRPFSQAIHGRWKSDIPRRTQFGWRRRRRHADRLGKANEKRDSNDRTIAPRESEDRKHNFLSPLLPLACFGATKSPSSLDFHERTNERRSILRLLLLPSREEFSPSIISLLLRILCHGYGLVVGDRGSDDDPPRIGGEKGRME